jgi:hypothetical protein
MSSILNHPSLVEGNWISFLAGGQQGAHKLSMFYSNHGNETCLLYVRASSMTKILFEIEVHIFLHQSTNCILFVNIYILFKYVLHTYMLCALLN